MTIFMQCFQWTELKEKTKSNKILLKTLDTEILYFNIVTGTSAATNSSFYITLNGGDTLKAVMW